MAATIRECTAEEREIIRSGVAVFGHWADGKPITLGLTTAMQLATRFAARMGIDLDEFSAYARRAMRDAQLTRSLQQACGPDASTALDGDRRIVLPHEGGDPL